MSGEETGFTYLLCSLAHINQFEIHIKEQVANEIIERGQMLPRQGEMGENTPFTRKCTSEPLGTLKRVTTGGLQTIQ